MLWYKHTTEVQITFDFWMIAFLTVTPEEEEEFFFELTGKRVIVPITKEAESDEAHDASLSLNLYR